MQLIEELSDADVAEVRESARLFAGVDETTSELRRVLDFFCALRWLTAGMKKRERFAFEKQNLFQPMGTYPAEAYALLANGPDAINADSLGEERVVLSRFLDLWKKARLIADREGFLHWEVAFPGVWREWQNIRPQGGFDAVIGNPPWDRIEQQGERMVRAA